MNYRLLLMTLFFLSPVLGFTKCTDTKLIETCQKSHRQCVKSCHDGLDRCGHCEPGYIQLAPRTLECRPIHQELYTEYMSVFRPKYLCEKVSDEMRQSHFLAVANEIAEYNAREESFELSLNEWSVYTEEEFQHRLGFQKDHKRKIDQPSRHRYLAAAEVPDSVDWVANKAVTSVVNQESCGCCFGVAAIGALEGAAAIASNFTWLNSLSFQQIISCDASNNGCNGGDPYTALQYIASNQYGGSVTSSEYPFSDGNGQSTDTCGLTNTMEVAADLSSPKIVTDTSMSSSSTNLVALLKAAVAEQPVVIAMNADCSLLKNYASGILITDGACSTPLGRRLDHAVLLVGYGTENGVEYWKIKNSWGTSWGEDGYFRVATTVSDDAKYGLFGMLAYTLIPTGAQDFIVTSTSSNNSSDPIFSGFIIGLIVAISLGVLAIVAGFLVYSKQKKKTKKETPFVQCP